MARPVYCEKKTYCLGMPKNNLPPRRNTAVEQGSKDWANGRISRSVILAEGLPRKVREMITTLPEEQLTKEP